MKDLYLDLFACVVAQEAQIPNLVLLRQMGEVGARIYFSFLTFKTRSWRDFTPSSISPPNYQGRRVIIILVWQLTCSDVFYVHSFYNSLLEAPSISFPWQSIWCVKVPKRVSFFL